MNQHYIGGGHVAVKTCNMEESIAFYTKIGGKLLQLESLPDGNGRKQLALLSFAGFVLEFDRVRRQVEAPPLPCPALLRSGRRHGDTPAVAPRRPGDMGRERHGRAGRAGSRRFEMGV